jgi:GrpB-like predicted nucleotidyltransferase (UPF0157 family)
MATAEEITRHHEDDPDGIEWVGIDPPPRPIEVVEPDPDWPAQFGVLAARIRAALGDQALAVDHVGSTSVPGLAAKPIIDIDVTVPDPRDEPVYVPAFEAAGFRLRLREPRWHQHRLVVADDPRANIHVFGPDCPEAIRHRMLRDWLIEHPHDRDRYAAAKRESAAQSNVVGEAVMAYNSRKEPVIRDILDRMFRASGLL